MSAVLALIAITVQIKMVSGIGNNTINVKVQKGETVVFKCSSSGATVTWLGPDVNNAGKHNLVYFSNTNKNPQLNQAKYLLQKNKGGYDLIIKHFQKENTGFYFCRFDNDGQFHETRYNVTLVVPKNQQGNKEQTSVIMLVMVPVLLLGGSFTIVGLLARVKGTTIGEIMSPFLVLCQIDAERHTAAIEEINDLGVSDDSGSTSNYRKINEPTAVQKLHECIPGLHYAEVLIKPVDLQQNKIHRIENRTIYTGIDHSLNRGAGQSDHSDNERGDNFIYIQNLDVNRRNYENTCL